MEIDRNNNIDFEKLEEKGVLIKVANSYKINPNSNFWVILIRLLKEQNLTLTKNYIKNYLLKINKITYLFLVMDLIKISYLEKDYTFEKPILLLLELTTKDINLEVASYLLAFFDALTNKNYNLARLYLDILTNINALKENCPMAVYLKEKLSKEETKLVKTKQKIPNWNNLADTDGIYVVKLTEIMTLLKEGKNLDEITKELNLSSETKYLFLLLLAKTAYLENLPTIGDYYLKIVIKATDKTQLIINKLNLIQKSKTIYLNNKGREKIVIKLPKKLVL